MGEHVDRADSGDAVFRIEQRYVARLCGRIATHIHDARRLGIEDHFDYIGMHAGTGRIHNHHIGMTVSGDKFIGQHILHVACIEIGIGQPVDLRIEFGVADGVLNIFYADYLACLRGYEVCNSACAGVKVIDQFLACESGIFSCYFI